MDGWTEGWHAHFDIMRKCKNITLALYEMILILLMWKFSFIGFMQHKYRKLEPVTVKECIYKWWPFN